MEAKALKDVPFPLDMPRAEILSLLSRVRTAEQAIWKGTKRGAPARPVIPPPDMAGYPTRIMSSRLALQLHLQAAGDPRFTPSAFQSGVNSSTNNGYVVGAPRVLPADFSPYGDWEYGELELLAHAEGETEQELDTDAVERSFESDVDGDDESDCGNGCYDSDGEELFDDIDCSEDSSV